MLKARGEVLERIEKLKDVNEEAYNKVVDEVTDKYKKAKSVDVEELLLLAADLKRHWRKIKDDVVQAKVDIERAAQDVGEQAKQVKRSVKPKKVATKKSATPSKKDN